MVLGFGKGKKQEETRPKASDSSDEEYEDELESVRILGPLNGKNINLAKNANLAERGLGAAKRMITDAVSRRAETLRIDPRGNAATITLSVDGIAYPGGRISKQKAMAVVQVIKLLAGLETRERTKRQSGGMKAEWENSPYELRVESTPAAEGTERLVVRCQNLKHKLETPADLGFSDEFKERIRKLTSQKKGVLLVCGTPDSGVTTTTSAVVRAIDPYLFSIYTIADTGGRELNYTKEFEVPDGEELGSTIDRIVREEADVLYVDPVRDAEMAKLVFTRQKDIAFVAELTAKDAAQGLLKCIELLGDNNLVADGLQGIIGQRLIRLLCDECKQAYRPNPPLLKKVGIPPETKILYRERKAPSSKEGEPDIESCDNCGGTGYFGRVGMYECIQMSAGMRKVVLGEPTLASIKTQVRQEKMQTLQSEGLRLVAQGKTSLEELQRAFKTP